MKAAIGDTLIHKIKLLLQKFLVQKTLEVLNQNAANRDFPLSPYVYQIEQIYWLNLLSRYLKSIVIPISIHLYTHFRSLSLSRTYTYTLTHSLSHTHLFVWLLFWQARMSCSNVTSTDQECVKRIQREREREGRESVCACLSERCEKVFFLFLTLRQLLYTLDTFSAVLFVELSK